MRPLPPGVKLERAEIPGHMHSVKASYAVLLNDSVEGHVDKYVETTMTHPGTRGGRGQRHRTDTYWGWRRPGKPHGDHTGYDTRGDAIDWLLKSLDVPRETKEGS